MVSTMVLAELQSRPFYDETRYRIIRDIFYTNLSYVRVVTLNPRLADLASTIGAQNPALSPPDAVHIATALSEQVDALLNQYQGGMCISGVLTMTERAPRHLIPPLVLNWVGTESAV